MGEVKSAFEKAMEKIREIEGLTAEEKAELKDREALKELLAAFYKGALSGDEIGERFRGLKAPLLKEGQYSVIDSLRLGDSQEEIRQKGDFVVAIEKLKGVKNTGSIGSALEDVERVQKEYHDVKEGAVRQVRAAVEANPQLRIRQVRSPDGRVLQSAMTVDEAVQAKMAEFSGEHERRYEAMFTQGLVRLKKELK